MTKNGIDIQKIIEDNWVMHKFAKDGEMSKTIQFMLPSLDLTISTIVIKAFVNAYIDDKDYEHAFKCPIFLLFKMNNKKDWDIIYNQLINNKNYVLDYNCGQKNGEDLIMVVFEVPEMFYRDYHYFKQSRYSKFSPEYKKKFSRYLPFDNKKQESVIWQVIHRSDGLKRIIEQDLGLKSGFLDDQDEIWGEINKETEIYNYKKTI